jgi:hypothetical protein
MSLQRYELTDNRPVLPVNPLPDSRVIFVRPAAGHSIQVELSFDGVVFVNWSAGTVTTNTERELDLPVEVVRFTRTAGTGGGSFVGVA